VAGRPELRLIEGGGRPRPPLAAALELAALGAGLTLAMALIAALPSWRGALGTLQALMLLAFAFYALALLRRARYAAIPGVSAAVFAVALAARLALVTAPPGLSDDIDRYVWEGRVLAHGGDPWRQRPLDPALAPLRDARVFPRVNHPELATVYPPLAEAGFALVASVSPTVLAMKAWVVLNDLALVLVLLLWARRRGEGGMDVVAYAWNPLVLLEYAGNGHHDPTAMVWLGLAFLLAARRPVASALALAAGALVKLVPLLALPFLWGRWPWRARVTCALLLAIGLAAFGLATRGADSGLSAYWERWRNNELVFHYLEAWTRSFVAARAIALGLVAAAIVFALRRRWRPPRATALAIGTALIVGPVLHPWYLGWVLMFAPLAPSAPWLLLSCTALLNYGVFAPPPEGAAFHLALGWKWVEYGLPLAVALVLALRARARGARRDVPWREAG